MILNLKSFSDYIEHQHFKMETIWDTLTAIVPCSFMVVADLQNAFLVVPISKWYWRFLKFRFRQNILLFGTAIWSCLFTKGVHKNGKSSSFNFDQWRSHGNDVYWWCFYHGTYVAIVMASSIMLSQYFCCFGVFVSSGKMFTLAFTTSSSFRVHHWFCVHDCHHHFQIRWLKSTIYVHVLALREPTITIRQLFNW